VLIKIFVTVQRFRVQSSEFRGRRLMKVNKRKTTLNP
jgi:hypothetical protein